MENRHQWFRSPVMNSINQGLLLMAGSLLMTLAMNGNIEHDNVFSLITGVLLAEAPFVYGVSGVLDTCNHFQTMSGGNSSTVNKWCEGAKLVLNMIRVTLAFWLGAMVPLFSTLLIEGYCARVGMFGVAMSVGLMVIGVQLGEDSPSKSLCFEILAGGWLILLGIFGLCKFLMVPLLLWIGERLDIA